MERSIDSTWESRERVSLAPPVWQERLNLGPIPSLRLLNERHGLGYIWREERSERARVVAQS